MGITPNTFSNGDLLTEASVRTELDRVKAWINGGVVVGDINSAVLAKEHVYKTETAGYPKNNTEGQQQQVLENLNGLNEPTPYPMLRGSSGIIVAIDQIEETRTVFLEHMLDGDRFILETMRVEVFNTADVEIVVTCFAGTTNDNSSVDDANAGNLRVRYKAIGGSETTVAGSIRKVPVSDEFSAILLAKESSMFEMLGYVEGLAAGTYDFWLEYQRGGASTGLGQVTVAQPTILIEVFDQ
jgi:hypothetical protein